MLHNLDQFLEVNPAAVKIMGYTSADQIVGRHPKDTSPPTEPDGRDSAVAAPRRTSWNAWSAARRDSTG